MKSMKYRLCMLAGLAALCIGFTGAEAADIRQSDSSETLAVIGDSYSAYENISVAVFMPGIAAADIKAAVETGEDISDITVFLGTAVAGPDGKLSFAVPMKNCEKGIYKAFIAGEEYDVGYWSNSDRTALVDELVGAGDNLQSVLEENYRFLSIDEALYKACGGATKITRVLAPESAGCGLTSASENALGKMSALIDRVIAVTAANERKLSQLSQIEPKLADGEYTGMALNLSERITERGKACLLNDIQGQSYVSVAAADKGYARELILKAICYPTVKTSTEIMGIMEKYNGVLGLDLSAFYALSAEQRAGAAVKFSSSAPSLSNMQTALDAAVKDYRGSNGSGNSSGGGGGNSSSGSSGSSVYALPQGSNTSSSARTDSEFDDLDGFAWAKQAISALNARGIVSGYDNKKFAPENSITREEFVKLVVSAFFTDKVADGVDFEDVAADAWYSKYIAVAVREGVVSGIGSNKFGIGNSITRQDMAVILHRIAPEKLVYVGDGRFDDDESISEYAKEAVYALRAAGIINGISDTEFAPLKSATRAEAVVMLYGFLNYLNGGV